MKLFCWWCYDKAKKVTSSKLNIQFKIKTTKTSILYLWRQRLQNHAFSYLGPHIPIEPILKKKKATPAPNGFTLQYCKQLRATVNVTFDLRVPLIQPRFSRVLEYYGCFRARLLHTTVDIPYYTDFVTSKLSFLRSTKFKSWAVSVAWHLFLSPPHWGGTMFKAARKRPLRRRKHLFSFDDSMTQQHDLAEIVHMPKFTTLNNKLGRWRGSELGQSLKLSVAYHN